MGLDPDTIPGNVAELEAYMATMIPRLAYTAESGRIRALMVRRKLPRNVSEVVTHLMKLAAVDLLTDDMRQLYGYWWGPLQRGLLATASNGLIRAAVKKAPSPAPSRHELVGRGRDTGPGGSWTALGRSSSIRRKTGTSSTAIPSA